VCPVRGASGPITSATPLRDAYFSGGTARGLMAKLAARPGSVLVGAEP
jgi:putative ABC transport system permease protein